jgi:hypothetical protein
VLQPALDLAHALDRRLLAVPRSVQRGFMALALLVVGGAGLTNVPRAFADFSGVPLLQRIHQYDTYGTDTIADMYESKVILHDARDMYTKARTPQTPLEAATWSKEASSPYPPAVLLAMAGLYAMGERTGAGFYGVMLAVACLFLALSAAYSLRTRWYVFPLAWLNLAYLARRFFYVADDSYLLMLLVVTTALFLARARRPGAHLLMAVATVMKLSPLYYVRHLGGMNRASAIAFVAVLLAGLVLPYFVWPDYLSIFRFHEHAPRAAGWSGRLAAAGFATLFALVLWYVETRLRFDLEDRIGWSCVPFALLLAFGMNAARHLIVVLLVPDKRVARNLALAAGLGLYWLLPWKPEFNTVTYLVAAFLCGALVYYLRTIGWGVVGDDVRHPVRTMRMMLSGADRGGAAPETV